MDFFEIDMFVNRRGDLVIVVHTFLPLMIRGNGPGHQPPLQPAPQPSPQRAAIAPAPLPVSTPAGSDLASGDQIQHDPTTFLPLAFTLPRTTNTPTSLFVNGVRKPGAGFNFTNCGRFFRHPNGSGEEFLIYTHGFLSLDNPSNHKAGCAFIYYPQRVNRAGNYGTVAFRLEDHGPKGIAHTITTQRAELRAVIAALQFRDWSTEGWKSLVIATDSANLIDGATRDLQKWERNGWKTVKGKPIQNRDLWELLLKEMRKFCAKKLQLIVSFWKISKTQNSLAVDAAKTAARKADVKKF